MHEISLTECVLQLLEDAAVSQGFSRVRTVWLEIGQLASVEKQAMQFAFEVVMRGTLAQDAKLEIIDTLGQGWCMKCAMTVAMSALYCACPQCGSYQLQVTSGTEMRVKELEVE